MQEMFYFYVFGIIIKLDCFHLSPWDIPIVNKSLIAFLWFDHLVNAVIKPNMLVNITLGECRQSSLFIHLLNHCDGLGRIHLCLCGFLTTKSSFYFFTWSLSYFFTF